MSRLAPILLALCGCAVDDVVAAQEWPTRPVTMVVPFGAGGGTDGVARFVADRLTARLGQPVIVENRAGAASAIGTARVARAAADGYTVLMTTNSAQVILPLTQNHARLNYSVRDFTPIGLVATVPNVLVASPKLSVNTLSELIAHAKANPGKLNFASSGVGTVTHLTAELFNARAGIDAVHVSYRTGVDAAADLMEGRIDYMFDNIVWPLPLIREGKLRGLGITTPSRSGLAPDLPTVTESGLPGFESVSWIGLVVPAGTPERPVQRLGEALSAVLEEPQLVDHLAKAGAEPASARGPDAFRELLSQDTARWEEILREGVIKLP